MVRRCPTSCRLSPPVGLLDATIPSPPPRHAGSTYTLTPFSGPARPRMRFVTGTGAHSFNMTVFGWIGLALVILFIASWTFLEYVTIRGVESVATRAVRRLREWWRRR